MPTKPAAWPRGRQLSADVHVRSCREAPHAEHSAMHPTQCTPHSAPHTVHPNSAPRTMSYAAGHLVAVGREGEEEHEEHEARRRDEPQLRGDRGRHARNVIAHGSEHTSEHVIKLYVRAHVCMCTSNCMCTSVCTSMGMHRCTRACSTVSGPTSSTTEVSSSLRVRSTASQ